MSKIIEQELSLQQIQQESLKVLLKIDEICKENGWRYFLFYGTLLGCIRHQGFIPWDDDIDIWMPREDFEKFSSWCEEHEKDLKPFKLCNRKNTKNYVYAIPRFSNMEYKYINTYERLQQFDIGVFVDIYPIDNFCSSYKKAKELERKINIYNILYNIYVNGMEEKKIFKRMLKLVIRTIIILFKGQNWNLCVDKEIADLIYRKTTNNDLFIGDPVWKNPYNYIAQRQSFTESISKSFCGYEFPVPKEYDKILTELYGDYMVLPPKDKQIAHHNYKIYLR